MRPFPFVPSLSLVLWLTLCLSIHAEAPDPDDDLHLARKPSKELIAIYKSNGTLQTRIAEAKDAYSPRVVGQSRASQDRERILRILNERNDLDSSAFFREILLKQPSGIDPRYIQEDGSYEVGTVNPNDWFIIEHAEAYKFFAKRDDFVDSPVLFQQLKKYPCTIQFTSRYIIAKRDRLTPELKSQLNKLDLSRDGEYFDAWARYLKIRLLDRPADQVLQDSRFISNVFLDSITHKRNSKGKTINDFYTIIEPVGELAKLKNTIAMQSMFRMKPQLDGHASEMMSYYTAEIALIDFDFFIRNAHQIMKDDQLYSMLEGIWACDLDCYEFATKYEKKLHDKNYPYYREINYILTGPPGHK